MILKLQKVFCNNETKYSSNKKGRIKRTESKLGDHFLRKSYMKSMKEISMTLSLLFTVTWSLFVTIVERQVNQEKSAEDIRKDKTNQSKI